MEAILAKIVGNTMITEGFYCMELDCPTIAAEAKPGQFIMLRPQEGMDPLLGRPFGFEAIMSKEGRFCIIYKVMGKATAIMSRLLPGAKVSVLGPLGNGFTIDKDVKKVLIASGGVGIAPLLPLARALLKQGVELKFLLGATVGRTLLAYQELMDLGADVLIVSVDGTRGVQGMVTDFSAKEIMEKDWDCIYTCGPRIMMQKIAQQAQAAGIPCQVSLEERMGCGFGICMGCVCQTKEQVGAEPEMKRVCCDGPVFDGSKVVW